MKSLLTLGLIAFSFTFLSAQSLAHYTYDYNQFLFKYKPIQYTPTKDVQQIEFVETNRKGKQKKYRKEFTKGNMPTKFIEYKKGQEKVKIESTYSPNDKVESTKVYKKGELEYSINYKRNEQQKPVEQTKTMANGTVKYKNVWTYNADGCLQEYSRYKNGDKLDRRNTYEYFSPCERSKMMLFNSKGKLKKTWTFDCKQEGEVLIEKKDVTQVCKWEESDGEYLTKVYQTFDEKGRIYKNVSKYTIKDTLIVETKSYNESGVMTYMATYDNSYERPIIRNYYSQKGKLKWGNKYEYVNEQAVSYQYMRKGKVLRTSSYEYNSDQLLTKFTSLDKKGELSRTIELQYN